MVYDKRDRLVLTQDGNQRAASPKQWTYTKYDQLNRPIMTGIYENNTDDRSTLQSTLDGTAIPTESLDNSKDNGYTDNQSFPTSGILKTLTVTFYDNYDFLGATQFNANYDFAAVEGFASSYQSDPRGQVTGGKVKVINDDSWLKSAHYYNDKLQLIQAVAETYEGKYSRTSSSYNFTGNVVDTETTYTLDDDSQQQIAQSFTYDHQNRPKEVWHQLQGNQKILMNQNVYDEIGRLEEKNLHSIDSGGVFNQSVDYRYNVRGWLTSINNTPRTNDGVKNNDTDDLFGMELYYDQNPSGLTFTNQYNGNISGMTWSNEHYDGTQKSYGFAYDDMNRITGAIYKEKTAILIKTKIMLKSLSLYPLRMPHMDIQAEKYTLIERITQIKDSGLIARLKQFLAANESDFWNELDEELKASIERGLSQSGRGEVQSHEEVMEKYKKWL